MNWVVDSHAHLDDEAFDNDREEIIEAMRESGIGLVIDPGADMESSRRSVALSKQHDFIYSVVGIHPHDAEGFIDSDLMELAQMTSGDKVIGIGEIGLDYYYDNSPREIQKDVFIKQMELAEKLQLPVVIHTRDATEDTYEILSMFKGKVKGVMHCYSGSWEMAKRYMDLGYYISLSGTVTFKNARVAKEVATNIPLEKLLIETDSPYLSPVPNRGKRNDPRNVRYVAEEIARLKGITADIVVEKTRKNTLHLYGLDESLI